MLTSLDPDKNRPPLRLRSWNINEKLTERFHKEMWKLPYPVDKEIVHFATAADLYQVLKDPEVTAVIWVGHAGFAEGQGLSLLRSIIDYKGNDLKAVFQAAGSHLKYLALVGCRGQLFLNEWSKKGYFDHNPQLETFGREVRTDARKGLKMALRNLNDLFSKKGDFLKQNSIPSDNDFLDYQTSDRGEYFEVALNRENDQSQSTQFTAIQVLQKGRLVGFLSSDETQARTLIKKSKSLNDLKLVMDSGAPSSANELNLGRFTFKSDNPYNWKVFQTPNGKPIGVGKHIYRAQNTMP